MTTLWHLRLKFLEKLQFQHKDKNPSSQMLYLERIISEMNLKLAIIKPQSLNLIVSLIMRSQMMIRKISKHLFNNKTKQQTQGLENHQLVIIKEVYFKLRKKKRKTVSWEDLEKHRSNLTFHRTSFNLSKLKNLLSLMTMTKRKISSLKPKRSSNKIQSRFLLNNKYLHL